MIETYEDRHVDAEKDMEEESDRLLEIVMAALAAILLLTRKKKTGVAIRAGLVKILWGLYMRDLKEAIKAYAGAIAEASVDWEADLIEEHLGDVSLKRKKPAGILKLVFGANLIEKRTLQEWLIRAYKLDVYNLYKLLQNAEFEGWTDEELEAELKKYFRKPRNVAKTLLDAATFSTLAHTRLEVFNLYKKHIKALKWISTLDSRTTPGCIQRADKLYTLEDKKPIGHAVKWEVPGAYHWRCRSFVIPIFYKR